jgi:hypothetical protein
MSLETQTHYSARELDIKNICEWLRTKGITVWLNWDITDPKERREAAEYFYTQMESYINFIDLKQAKLDQRILGTHESGFDVV